MELHIRLRRRHLVAPALVATALLVGGVAYASIPDAGGVYTACELNATGTIRLIDPSLGSKTLLGHCTALESRITWNQAGQPGVSPTVAQLAVGDPNCPAGGASITDAAGTTAYVCNGKPFAGSFQSPNGQYTLQVTDTGVSVTGPSAGITLSGGNLGLTADAESVQVSGDRSETVGVNDALTVGGVRTESVGGNASTSVGGSQSVTIGKDRSVQIGADDGVTVGGGRTTSVAGSDTLGVGQNRTENVAGDETVHISGNKSEKDGLDYQHEAGNDITIKGGGNGLIEMSGILSLKASTINQN